jgi:hypothetical protein
MYCVYGSLLSETNVHEHKSSSQISDSLNFIETPQCKEHKTLQLAQFLSKWAYLMGREQTARGWEENISKALTKTVASLFTTTSILTISIRIYGEN